MVSVIHMESMPTRARLRYTRNYLTPGISSPIEPAAMEKMMSFPTQIHTVMLKFLLQNDKYDSQMIIFSALNLNNHTTALSRF